MLRKRAAERVAHPRGVDAGGHRAVVQTVEEFVSMPRSDGQARGAIAHE
jgi:hypothetical protein